MPATTSKSHERNIKENILERFNARENFIDGDCILWSGAKTPQGYGYIKQFVEKVGTVKKSITIFVHRLSYQQAYGEIPQGMVIDHICHNPSLCIGGTTCKHRQCINPEHLKLSTHEDNTKRSAISSTLRGVCRNGLHDWNEENVKVLGDGKKVCVPCKKAQAKKAYIKRVGN
jgi:hypothetical protein